MGITEPWVADGRGTNVSLPIYHSEDRDLMLLQTNWTAQLNPLLSSPLSNSLFLSGISLINGTTTLNHFLGRVLQGWILAGVNGAATIYDTQSTNSMKDKTLVLVSNAAVKVNLIVF